jgi:DNA-binding transcriptional ArsR family regulator
MQTTDRSLELEGRIFQALSHPFRLQVLDVLRNGEVCVCHLAALFDRPQPYVSKQLAELKEAGLVIDRREGFRIYYSLTDPSVGTIIDSARLLLLRLGLLDASSFISPAVPTHPVAGCECPRCRGDQN